MRDPGGVLGEIVARKREDVAARLDGQTLEALRETARPTPRSLAAALARPGARFVMEMKRTSPSKGASAGHEPIDVARAYSGVADAISVLTDGPYFNGSFDDLAIVRSAFDGPILCKDFTVDVRQVAEARAYGADAVLIMLSVLDDDEAAACLAEAKRFAMDPIVEVHDEEELGRALRLGAGIIGINNRDLRSLETHLSVTERLAPLVPEGPILVSESGIATHEDVLRLAPWVDAFLVGSSLMAQPDIAAAARRLVYGRVKVCGLTRIEDLEAAKRSGASYGGLIFAEGSPRRLSDMQADVLAAAGRAHALPLVGVFRDAPVEKVAETAERLDLAAVQLHGGEDDYYIAELRQTLSPGCEIWDALPMSDGLDPPASHADRVVFDCKADGTFGGTGKRFDWDRLRDRLDLVDGLLAGGLAPDNIAEASGVGAWGLDVNSGVEDAPGIKSAAKLAALFDALRPSVRQGVRGC
jgi:indole-3-glycerol phosphate synthase/phosphoribosylanthranilate isomerase